MSNFIEHIHIENFKSIKDCTIEGCKQINLFIGRPNVGKSNILEALSLFSVPYLREGTPRKLTNLIRLENEAELFYKGNTQEQSRIECNVGLCQLWYSAHGGGLQLHVIYRDTNHIVYSEKEAINLKDGGYIINFDQNLNAKGFHNSSKFEPPIKRYSFKSDVKYKKGHARYLMPPFGNNLLSIILEHKELKSDVEKFFRDYRAEIAFDRASHTLKVIQNTPDGIFLIPYNSIADTLQRIIFYKAAIESNTNSILLFEEPEAHSFPPYMTHLTQEMIYRKDNQYFVATHSPFILNDLLENGREELAVFIVYYEEGQTRVRLLSQEELHQAYQNGIDLFTNSEIFT